MAVMIAALMNDPDSVFNSSSTLFTIDIWKRVRKESSVREWWLLVGKISFCTFSYWVIEVVKLKLYWNQFGVIKGSSIVDALVYLLHNMFIASELIGTFVQTLFVDYQKAFDPSDHNIIGVPDILRLHDTIHPPFWGLAGITGANGGSWN